MRSLDGYLRSLRIFIAKNPMKEGQSLQERALELYKQGLEAYDQENAKERAIREEQAHLMEQERFYCFFHYSTRTTHVVKVKDLAEFSKKVRVPIDALLKLGEGEIRDYKGQWLRGNNPHAKGRAWKPPVDQAREHAKKRLEEEEKKRQAQIDSERYTMPPEHTTVHFVPTND